MAQEGGRKRKPENTEKKKNNRSFKICAPRQFAISDQGESDRYKWRKERHKDFGTGNHLEELGVDGRTGNWVVNEQVGMWWS